MSHRLFIGLRPPRDVRAALLAEMHGVHRARWQNDDQLHLTLRYIGEVDRHTANDLVDELGRVTASPFTMQLRGTGVFEKKALAHTLWAGVSPNPLLDRLQRRVEQSCQAAGILPGARKFIPHVTLARLNAGSGPVIGFLERTTSLAPPDWQVSDFVLYESHLRSEGSLYQPILRFALTPVS